MHTETSNRFYQIVHFLPVGKGEEHRSHCTDVLDKSTDIQQVAVDAKQFRQHHADGFNAIRHFYASQFFNCQHVRHLVNATTQVLNTVGIRNVAVPGLALAHLLRTTVVVTHIWHAVDNLFTIKLQHDTERTV
ncbi:Uncharacterised protein [Yersinia enterocolitica]|nr:Uncharacterised protein [Yersinia enterocolitica]